MNRGTGAPPFVHGGFEAVIKVCNTKCSQVLSDVVQHKQVSAQLVKACYVGFVPAVCFYGAYRRTRGTVPGTGVAPTADT